tara:strand:- start:680 stop:1216 length:537 start_codon:yes stop_codon:yes gene_type:complete
MNHLVLNGNQKCIATSKNKNPKTTTMKNNHEFIMLTILNNGTETLDYETTIGGLECTVYYFKDRDDVLIVFWCEWFEDELKFIRTSNFESFRDSIEANETLISFSDHWDYSSESVYQEYETQEFEDWIQYDGKDELKYFVEQQLKTHGIEYVKRSLKNRIQRWSEKNIFKLKNIVKCK